MIASLGPSIGSSAIAGLLAQTHRTSGSASFAQEPVRSRNQQPMPPPVQGSEATKSLFDALVNTTDADADGQVSAEEAAESRFGDLISKVFGKIDTNADGLLNEDEMAAAAKSITEEGGLFPLARAQWLERISGTGGEPPPTDSLPDSPPTDPLAEVQTSATATSMSESMFSVLTAETGQGQTSAAIADLAQRLWSAVRLAA